MMTRPYEIGTGSWSASSRGRLAPPAGWHRNIFCMLTAILVLSAHLPARAQELTLKPAPTPDQAAPCPTVAKAAAGAAAATRAADSLLAAASRAAILGDHEDARDLFREAAALDPLNPVVSYRLARTLDDQGDGEGAVLEYCRYLTIATGADDTGAARDRVGALIDAGVAPSLVAWNTAMAAGLEAYRRADYRRAAESFTRAIEVHPHWPDAHYNRALAHLAAGSRNAAAEDLESYLALSPFAPDHAVTRLELQRLRDPPLGRQGAGRQAFLGSGAPNSVLVQGLLFPGLGQHSTGRTGLGLAVLGGVGAALYFAAQEEEVVRLRGAEDPFGNYYEYEVSARERTNLIAGVGAAVAIAVAGAVESYLYASRPQARDDRVAAAPSAWRVEGLPSIGMSSGAASLSIVIRVNRPGSR